MKAKADATLAAYRQRNSTPSVRSRCGYLRCRNLHYGPHIAPYLLSVAQTLRQPDSASPAPNEGASDREPASYGSREQTFGTPACRLCGSLEAARTPATRARMRHAMLACEIFRADAWRIIRPLRICSEHALTGDRGYHRAVSESATSRIKWSMHRHRSGCRSRRRRNTYMDALMRRATWLRRWDAFFDRFPLVL